MAHAGSCVAVIWREGKMLKAFSITDIGKKRSMNQDYVYASADKVGKLPNLFIVADGMGGHNAGEYASRYTVETMIQEIEKDEDADPVNVIGKAIEKANSCVRQRAGEDRSLSGMGTTVVAATCVDGTLIVANVGDSRLYVVDDKIRQITRDHSLVEEMVRLGGLDREAARNHPDKNIITRAVGADDSVETDFFFVELTGVETILLCSDGLTNMLEDQEILKIVSQDQTLEEKAAKLVDAANGNGGRDNISVILVKP